jgi:hypothetical protein
MTNAPVRVQRNGEWENIDIDQLTDAELDAFAAGCEPMGWRWAKFLAKWSRENVKLARNAPASDSEREVVCSALDRLFADAITEAVKEEREACAKLAADRYDTGACKLAGYGIAEAIRKRTPQ